MQLYQDSAENPFEVALENLPHLIKYIKRLNDRAEITERNAAEDLVRKKTGKEPLVHDRSNEIIEDILDLSRGRNFALESAFKMKKMKPIVSGYKYLEDKATGKIKKVKTSFKDTMTKYGKSKSKSKGICVKTVDFIQSFFF